MFGVFYMFVALALVCEEFFVPSLEVLQQVLCRSETVIADENLLLVYELHDACVQNLSRFSPSVSTSPKTSQVPPLWQQEAPRLNSLLR